MEIATRRCPRLRVVWDSPTNKNPGYGAFPPDLVQLRSTLPVGALVLGNTRLLRAEALAGAEEDDLLLSCSVLLASSPNLPQIPCCAHAAPPRSFPF